MIIIKFIIVFLSFINSSFASEKALITEPCLQIALVVELCRREYVVKENRHNTPSGRLIPPLEQKQNYDFGGDLMKFHYAVAQTQSKSACSKTNKKL